MKGKILIVDDEPHMLRVTELSIKKGGYDIVIGRNGREALDLAARDPAFLTGLAAVVTDMELPGRSGAALLAELRARPAGAALPAIIVSGHAEATLRRDPAVRALLAEAVPPTGLLSKPYPMDELRARVGAVIGR